MGYTADCLPSAEGRGTACGGAVPRSRGRLRRTPQSPSVTAPLSGAPIPQALRASLAHAPSVGCADISLHRRESALCEGAPCEAKGRHAGRRGAMRGGTVKTVPYMGFAASYLRNGQDRSLQAPPPPLNVSCAKIFPAQAVLICKTIIAAGAFLMYNRYSIYILADVGGNRNVFTCHRRG